MLSLKKVMNVKTAYQAFEFDLIKAKIKNYAKGEMARRTIDDLVMFSDMESLSEELMTLDEMSSIILRYSNLPLSFAIDLLPLIELARKGGVLTPSDFDHIADDIVTSLAVIKYFNKAEGPYDRLRNYIKDFLDLTPLEKNIRKVITPSLTIYDTASPALKSIRKKILAAEQELQNRISSLVRTYSAYLSDANVTLRNGHFVLPVKTGDKRKVPGIIHDISDTGNTTFIEPGTIVEMNNKVYLLRQEELDEMHRILKALTALVLADADSVKKNNQMLGYLDFVQAKALYGNEISGFVAHLQKKQMISLHSARHPLIDKTKVVANTFYLDEEKRVIVISGPNAGGKTVALKVVGLLVLMNQCGLALPTSAPAELSFFKHIYVDIGDNQSLTDNLSTFSGHIKNIVEMTTALKGTDLILIDELGTGTDPREGEALAVGVLRFIIDKHALAMVSSHYSGLKEFAMSEEGIENASMIFDEERLSPTYKIKIGIPGRSYGLEVAERSGLRQEIIDYAKKEISGHHTEDVSVVLGRLEKQVRENEFLKDDLLNKEKQLNDREKKLQKDADQLAEKRQHLVEDAEVEKEEILAKTEAKIREIMFDIQHPNAKLHEVIAAKKKLEDLVSGEDEEESHDEIAVNDYVIIKGMGIVGKVIRIAKNRAYVTTPDGLSFETPLTKLTLTVAPSATVRPSKINIDDLGQIKAHVGLEHNVIGLHVDEALESVIKYLDDARIKHLKQVRIVHGSGTGALRGAIHDYLKQQSFVESYRLGGQHEGGAGATVVILK